MENWERREEGRGVRKCVRKCRVGDRVIKKMGERGEGKV